jgi:putative MATE family efflux protein
LSQGDAPARNPTRALDRDILRLALPALATLVAEPVYVLTDTAIVGHLGTTQLAGLSLASAALLTAHAVFIFLAYGTTSSVARLLGAGRAREAAGQAVQGLWLALGLGLLTGTGLAAAAGPIVRLLGGDGAVGHAGVVYLRVSAAGVPAQLLVLAGVGYLRGLQNTRLPLVVAVGTSLVNLGLEVWWIFGLGFGIGASAVATVAAQWVAAVAFLVPIVRRVRRLDVAVTPDPAALRGLLTVGVHLLVRTAALRVALLAGTVAAARLGTVDLAAYEIGFQVWSFLALALDSVAIAAQVLVGRSLGAGDAARARQVGRRVNQWGLATGALAGTAVIVGRGPLAQLFSDDHAVLAAARWSLWWVGLVQPLNGWVFALDGTLIGAGDQRYLAWATAVASAAFLPFGAAVAVTGAGLGWLWAALSLLMAARFAGLALRFGGDRWAVPGASRRSGHARANAPGDDAAPARRLRSTPPARS